MSSTFALLFAQNSPSLSLSSSQWFFLGLILLLGAGIVVLLYRLKAPE